MSEETDRTKPVVDAVYSATVVVADQDRAIAFYRDVLGCEVRTDVEAWPGARVVELVPAGAEVAVALLTADSGLPLGVRWHTADADGAHRSLVASGVPPHTDVLHLEGSPPMFTFDDPDGNTVIVMELMDEGDGVLQVVVDSDRAGGGLATVMFDDLAAAAHEARARGVDLDVAEGELVSAVAQVVDPDGNAITLVQA